MNEFHISRAINLLNLWLSPGLLKDKLLVEEVTSLLNKLLNSERELTNREHFLAVELIDAMSEGIITAIQKSEESEHSELLEHLKTVTKLNSLLLSCSTMH